MYDKIMSGFANALVATWKTELDIGDSELPYLDYFLSVIRGFVLVERKYLNLSSCGNCAGRVLCLPNKSKDDIGDQHLEYPRRVAGPCGGGVYDSSLRASPRGIG